jgi:hypothetical protein
MIYLHNVLECREIISLQYNGHLEVSYVMVVKVQHLMWNHDPIATALVLEVDFYVIFKAFNILFDDNCNKYVLFIWLNVTSILSLPLVNISFYLCLLKVSQDSYKLVGNVEIKMFGLLPDHHDDLLDLLLRDTLPLARLIPLLRRHLARLCDFSLIGCEVEPLLNYFRPVVVLLRIVFFEAIKLFGKKMLFSCDQLLLLLHRGLDSLQIIEEECHLSSQFIH